LPLPDIIIRASERDRLEHIARAAAERGDFDAMFLLEELSRARTVPDKEYEPDLIQTRVTMGSWVTYWTEADTTGVPRNTRQLVYPDQYRSWKFHLSVMTPLGAALIGLRVGSQMPFFYLGKMHHVRVEIVDKPSSNVVRLLFNRPPGLGHNGPPPHDDPEGPNAA
jgi:regulator of nucleoside diphosphate kinase